MNFNSFNGTYTGGDGWVDDIWHGSDQGELVFAKKGDDTLYGHGGDDVMFGDGDNGFNRSPTYGPGGRGNDFLDGGDGNDLIVGGNDADKLYGGAGDDTLIGDMMQAFAHVAAAPPEPIDYFPSADLLQGGVGNDHLYGNEGDDLLYGDEGDDWLEGGVGSDYLEGGADADMLIAGDGDDELNGGAGNDTLTGGTGNDKLFGLAGVDAIYGESGGDFIVGGPAGDGSPDLVYAGDGNDQVWGADGNDSFFGGAGGDELRGGVGHDALDGGTGADAMYGGLGDDTYMVDEAGDVVSELLDQGFDTVESSISYRLGEHVEGLMLKGTAGIGGYGNALDNRITGNAADNELMGEAGNDKLLGNEGNDKLNGGGGADYMAGGSGNDSYVIDNQGDQVVERPGDGIDSVTAHVTAALSTDVENLLLAETAGAINGTGNELKNLITGNAADNVISGGAGDDTLFGAAGNDLLDGGTGADFLAAGSGDDIYVVDNTGDSVSELEPGGTDRVQSAITYTLSASIENLTLIGTAAINGTGNLKDNELVGNEASNTLTGNAGNDLLDGGGGIDHMLGGLGDDTYIVTDEGDAVVEAANEGGDTVRTTLHYTLGDNVENLVLEGNGAINAVGNALANKLIGNAANNLLNGGAGADAMHGSFGDDTYVVDDAGDSVSELLNAGFDTVETSVHYALSANVEVLRLGGTGALNGTGNELDNTLHGNAGNNTLLGGGGADTLLGGGGSDRLDGGIGADTLRGGSGNDVYVVDSALDVIEENANEGTDSVQSSISYALSATLEHLTLIGTAALNATGNALNNTLTGNSAQNVLSGGAGNDTLSGGGGADVLLGGDGNDSFTFDALDLTIAGTRYDGGAGGDTLRFTGGARSLDLTTLSDERVIGVETIDLTGSGNNKLVLAQGDVLALSDIDTLTVQGNAGDTLTLVGAGWNAGVDINIGSELYHSYLNANATLLVDADVQAALVSGQA